MTKLAVYDKKHKEKDKACTKYYVEDYIYVKNFFTRLSVTVVALIFVILGVVEKFTTGIIFPTSLGHFLEVYIMPYLIPWIIGMIVYTIVSTYIYGTEYRKAVERQKEYKQILKELRQYDQEVEGVMHETE